MSECFELTSIVFRLAGASEYVNNTISNYANGIDNYFEDYNNHSLIQFLKDIREEYGISYDAVPKAAAYLKIEDGRVTINPELAVIKINEIDERGTEDVFQQFLVELDDFYVKTDFRTFYSQYTHLYELALEKMNGLLNELNTDWFIDIFGKGVEDAKVIVSLSNGPNNYAFSLDGENGIKGIVIGCGADRNGLPWFNRKQSIIIMHELLHFYTNNLIADYWENINVSAHDIYGYVKEDMRKLTYGNAKTVMNEWFTNVLVVLYLQENPINSLPIDFLLHMFHERGFIWMERSKIFMGHFCEYRNQFKTIDDYMPQLIGFINYTAENFDQVISEYNSRHPYVLDVFPALNSRVMAETHKIEIHFSEPMSVDIHGMNVIENENILFPPLVERPSFKDEYTYVILLDNKELEKGKIYGFKLIHAFFQSEKMYPMEEDFTYTFNTCEK